MTLSFLSYDAVIPIEESCHPYLGKMSFNRNDNFPGYQ